MKIKVLALFIAMTFGSAGHTFAGDDYTMIIAPARYSVMQVMFDVINKRSAVLVSYQQDDQGQALLHVWNGSYWTEVGLHDLGELNFVKQTPARAIMIGDNDLLPDEVEASLSAVPDVQQVRQIENAALLNELGRIMKWSQRDWAWFAARYNLTLEDEAAGVRKSSWYNQAGPLVREQQPVYQPVPVVDSDERLIPSSTTLPSPDTVSRTVEEDEPSRVDEDIDAPEAEEESSGTTEEVTDEIQEIVDTLEENTP